MYAVLETTCQFIQAFAFIHNNSIFSFRLENVSKIDVQIEWKDKKVKLDKNVKVTTVSFPTTKTGDDNNEAIPEMSSAEDNLFLDISSQEHEENNNK